MAREPLTLFQLLGISPNVPDSEIEAVLREAFQGWVVKSMRNGVGVPDDVQAAKDILADPESRASYRKLYAAWKRKTPLLCSLDEISDLEEFCKRALLHKWECPDGTVDKGGNTAPLTHVYVLITLEGEPPPWLAKRDFWRRHWKLIAITTVAVCLVISGWWTYEYVYEAPERLAAAIRAGDVRTSDDLDAVTKDETAFAGEEADVIGPMPADGSMPDDLARVCFRDKAAARAWESIRSREVGPSALAPFQQSKQSIEDRIKMGTFVETDRTLLDEDATALEWKRASFTELRRDLDLLRVLLEAERLPSAGKASASKGNP